MSACPPENSYLYVTQTIDLDNARRGQSLVDLKPETKNP